MINAKVIMQALSDLIDKDKHGIAQDRLVRLFDEHDRLERIDLETRDQYGWSNLEKNLLREVINKPKKAF